MAVTSASSSNYWPVSISSASESTAALPASSHKMERSAGMLMPGHDASNIWHTTNRFPLSLKDRVIRHLPLSTHMASVSNDKPQDIQIMDLSKCPKISDTEFIKLIRGNPQIEGLNLSGCYRLTDRAFRYLANLENLKYFNCSDCPQITMKGLRHIPTRHLIVLEMRRMEIAPDLFVELFSRASELAYLDLQGAAIELNDTSMSLISKLSKLECLNLTDCHYGGTRIGLRALSNLKRLVYYGSPSYGKGTDENHYFQILSGLKNLKILNLPFCSSGFSSLRYFSRSNLESLSVNLEYEIEKGLQFLPRTIKTLRLGSQRSDIPEEFYSSIGRLSQLERLEIPYELDGDLIGRYWSHIVNLTEITGLRKQKNHALERICDLNPNLKTVICDRSHRFDANIISAMAKLTRLTNVELVIDFEPRLLFDAIAAQAVPPPLISVVIDSSKEGISLEETWKSLLPFAKSLQHVAMSLHGSAKIKDERNFVEIVSQFTELRSLKVDWNISPEGSRTILSHMPKMETITYLGNRNPATFQVMTPIFQAMGAMPRLKVLRLLETGYVQNEDFGFLASTALSHLDLECVTGLSDEAASSISTIQTLRRFYVLHTALPPLAERSMQRLREELRLERCAQTSMAEFLRSYPE